MVLIAILLWYGFVTSPFYGITLDDAELYAILAIAGAVASELADKAT